MKSSTARSTARVSRCASRASPESAKTKRRRRRPRWRSCRLFTSANSSPRVNAARERMLIDAHAHLDKYSDDELARTAGELSSGRFFTWAVSMDVSSYQRTLDIAPQSAWMLPTFGVHPRRAPEYAGNVSELGPYIDRSPALGEIGLDFHWVKEREHYPAQVKVLEYFLAAAREQDKVVNLHTKGAERETLELLERYDIRRAIIHWYSGPPDILRALV